LVFIPHIIFDVAPRRNSIRFKSPIALLVYHMPIEPLRAEISRIDEEIIELITRRQRLAGRIAQVKMNEGLPIHDKARSQAVLETAFESAVEKNINPVHVQKIFEILIEMSEERQRECSGDGNLP